MVQNGFKRKNDPLIPEFLCDPDPSVCDPDPKPVIPDPTSHVTTLVFSLSKLTNKMECQ